MEGKQGREQVLAGPFHQFDITKASIVSLFDQSIPGSEAFALSNKNAHRLWNNSKRGSAKSRFDSGRYFHVFHQSKFKIGQGGRVFTMGSCFAREIEDELDRQDFTVLTKGYGIERKYYHGFSEGTEHPDRLDRGMLNKYNVHSMRVEVERALVGMDIAEEGLIQVGEKWFDPQASHLNPTDKATAMYIRERIKEATRRILEADVIIFTLGLTETWVDQRTLLPLNQPPSPISLKSDKDRYRFYNARHGDVVHELNRLLAIVRAATARSPKIVLTVSPVPLQSTWTGKDVVVANSYSKSTLRSAVDEVVEANEDVDYFPSYEIVTNSERACAWEDDCQHVKRGMVEFIMRNFSETFIHGS